MNAGNGLTQAAPEQLSRWLTVFGLFTWRNWIYTALGAVFSLLLIAIPTSIIHTPFFTRMVPVRPQDYIILTLTAILAGLIIGTYTLGMAAGSGARIFSGGFLSFIAVGCPVCNKLVLILLGTSGALKFFAPAQLYIGLLSIALLVWALHLRVKSISRGCAVPPGKSG